MHTVNLPISKIINYLRIAAKQRERAAKKFVEDYGPNAAVVAEVNAELGELQNCINQLLIESVTPLEQAIAKQNASTKK